MSHYALRPQILFWSVGEGGSESKSRRPEFFLSQVDNPSQAPSRTHDQILSHKSDCYVLRNLGAVGSRQIQAQVTLQLTVSQLVCLGVEPLMGLMTRMYVMSSLLQYESSCGVLSDERAGLSVMCLCQVCTYLHVTVSILQLFYVLYIHGLSVQAVFSRLCLILI
jgi:hypothetical protein